MNIFFACDKGYLSYLYITLCSILKNCNSEDEFSFYVMQDDFTDYEKNVIDRLKKIKDFNIEYLSVNSERLAACRRENHNLPIQTFYRYLISELKPDLDKVMYLDVDIEVQKSLSEFWNVDLKDAYVGVVKDPILDDASNFKKQIGFNVESIYFNAGILMMNLEQFRKHDLLNKLIDISIKNLNVFHNGDQDALNLVCENNKLVLPKKYNFRATYMRDEYEDLLGIENAVIKHYVGRDKKLLSLLKYFKYYPIHLRIKAIIDYLILICKIKLTAKNIKRETVYLLKKHLNFIYPIFRNIYRKIR